MKIFSVYLNEDLNIEKARFVGSGFSFKAFFFQVFWALYNRLWILAFMLVLFDCLCWAAFSFEMIQPYQMAIAKLLIMFYAGSSANLWQQIKYSKSHFQETIVAVDEFSAQKFLFENFIFSDNFKNK